MPKLYESIKGILTKFNLTTGYKPIRTLKQELMKKRPEQAKQHGVVYKIECGECDWKYVGESSRSVEERVEEHKRNVRKFDTHSEISNHIVNEDHQFNWSSKKILDKESNYKSRVVKEAIWSRHHRSGNKVKFILSNAWDDVI